MSHRFKTKKLTSALALCGIALFSIHANATYVFRVAVPGLKAQTGISISPASFNFGNVYAGQTTSSSFVVTNVGGLTVSGLQYQVSGPFTLSGNCGTSLAAGAQCTESITFAPTAGQAYSGTFTATNGSVASSTSLQGTGQQVILGVSPASLSFGGVLVGSSSTAQSFTLTNTGNVAATGLTLTAPSGYSESTTCGSTLAAGGTCTGTITFSPTTAGAGNSQVSITSSNATGTNVAVTGTGTTAVLSANALSFGTVNDYSTTTQSLTVNNSGTGTATPTFSSSSNAFSVSGCTSIPAGGSCTASVTLTTTSAGSYTSTLTINGGTGGAVTTNLSGTSQKVIQSFTATGAATWTVPARVSQVAVLVVGGGGGPEASGGLTAGLGGSGGGGGQVIYNPAYAVTPGATLSLTVGTGGDVGQDSTEDGTASTFGTLSAAGGLSAYEGGTSGAGYAGGTGTTATLQGAGGGGAGGAGSNGTTTNGGAGGPGVANSITGSVVYYGVGGGGAVNNSTGTPGAGGSGSTATGGTASVSGGVGAANTGSGAGGGGGGGRVNAAAGVVIISY
jgi:hypothetical protein